MTNRYTERDRPEVLGLDNYFSNLLLKILEKVRFYQVY